MTVNAESTTGRAAQIRAALKAKGWSSRAVSVKSEYFSMGSAIEIEIKSPAVPIEAVKAIAEGHEEIDRCELTGEILSGGNRYVNVRYSTEAIAALAAPWVEPVKAAIAKVEGSSLIPVEGTPFYIGKNDWRLSLWGETSHIQDVSGAEAAAATIGVRMLGRAEIE